MHDPGCELPRIPLLRDWVNKPVHTFDCSSRLVATKFTHLRDVAKRTNRYAVLEDKESSMMNENYLAGTSIRDCGDDGFPT
jgi:hypothetical protein